MQKQVKQTLQQYGMIRNGVVLAAVSGGRDSMALLHVLYSLRDELGFCLFAVHVNHGLREAGESEQLLVQAYAQELGVKLEVINLCVADNIQQGESIEMAARRMRYAAFGKALSKLPADSVLATAHHGKDQAETVLMHLIRGSGIRGLAGIQPVRWPFVRPMLYVPYDDIEAYVAQYQIPYLVDQSNRDIKFLRNRIRHCLLPELKSYNPNVERALCTTALAAQEDDACLLELARAQKAQADYQSIPGFAAWMNREKLSSLPVPLLKRIVRMALEDIGVFHLEEATLSNAMRAIQSGTAVQLQKDVFIRGGLYVQVYRLRKADESVAVMPKSGTCKLGPFIVSSEQTMASRPNALWSVQLCTDIIEDGLQIRIRRKGDVIAYAFGHKKLSDALIDAHMPYCLRDHLPVLVKRDQIVWVPGLRIATGFSKDGQRNTTICILADAGATDGGVGV